MFLFLDVDVFIVSRIDRPTRGIGIIRSANHRQWERIFAAFLDEVLALQ